jgi:Transcriptional Coactivator p15 (PC4)
MSEPRIVYAFAKNSRDEVLATLTRFRGEQVADLRVWVDGPDDRPRATKKGLTLRVGQLGELRRAVDALIAAAEEDAP